MWLFRNEHPKSLKDASVQCLVSPKNLSCSIPFKHRLITSVSLTCHSRVIFGSQFGQEEGEEEREKLCTCNWVRIGIEEARTQEVHAFEL